MANDAEKRTLCNFSMHRHRDGGDDAINVPLHCPVGSTLADGLEVVRFEKLADLRPR